MPWPRRDVIVEDSYVPDASSRVLRRLAVAWQHPVTRAIEPVGILECDEAGYRFCYVRNALSVEGFRHLLGFPDLHRTYESTRLFPLFAQRVMDARRPDYGRYLTQLHLPEDAGPFELLGRSAGHRKGDTIQLCPEPFVAADGSTQSIFLVNGVRHVLAQDATAEQRFGSLRPGDRLILVDEPENTWNNRAILVSARDGQRLGWVPDLLLDYVHTVRDQAELSLMIEHVNGPEAPPHLRLLVRLNGQAPAGYRPFTGPRWEPVGSGKRDRWVPAVIPPDATA
jgi:hypothetical protein